MNLALHQASEIQFSPSAFRFMTEKTLMVLDVTLKTNPMTVALLSMKGCGKDFPKSTSLPRTQLLSPL